MSPSKSQAFPIGNESDIVHVRQAVRKWATELAFSLVDQTKIVTAASELARNTLIYGNGGEMRMATREEGIRRGLELVFEDKGPGIPDIALALQDGYTTGSGMGLGLSGAKRLSNEFEIASTPGEGTRIVIRRWR